ncbi:MAG: LysR family transcriptional regulator [Telluria sp.]
MTAPDFNLLLTLDVLLAEGSVARAARRLRLSPSAMSRSLARLREATGDPLLVRAGRGLVPTPRAQQLREQVARLVQEAEGVLRPAEEPHLASLVRTFTIRCSDGFVENFGAALLARMAAEAPGVRLRFVQKMDKDSRHLRDGSADLETGVVGGAAGPELRTRALFSDRFVGAVRADHALARGRVSVRRYVQHPHVLVSRDGSEHGLVDTALERAGMERHVAAIVSGFAPALALARQSDLVATVPERHTASLRAGLHAFTLPVEIAPLTISMLWHPRFDADGAHRWLRGCLLEVTQAASRRK